MNVNGRIGTYYWAEVPGDRLQIKDVVSALGEHLRGLFAMSVSWDSGLLQELSPVPMGWVIRGGRVVSPPLDDRILALWPQSSCNSGRYDEWYFGRVVPDMAELCAFCNWMGTSLAHVADIAYPGGFDLAAQLEVAAPEVVIGHGRFMFVIARDEWPVSKLAALWRAA